MKRENNLISLIADPDNLRLAFWKARKAKEGKNKYGMVSTNFAMITKLSHIVYN